MWFLDGLDPIHDTAVYHFPAHHHRANGGMSWWMSSLNCGRKFQSMLICAPPPPAFLNQAFHYPVSHKLFAYLVYGRSVLSVSQLLRSSNFRAGRRWSPFAVRRDE